jgi:6-phosphogluconolactonase
MRKVTPRMARLVIGALLACSVFAVGVERKVQAQGSTGAIFTMSNATTNLVYFYKRASTGVLTLNGTYPTQGTGAGGFNSQGAIIVGPTKHFLYVTNPGSDNITTLAIHPNNLTFVSMVSSGGTKPISLTAHGNRLYVLNYGSWNISGFTIGSNGSLTPIPNSTVGLSSTKVLPAEVGFSPDGTLLAVSESATNSLDTYTVDPGGIAHGPLVQNSNGVLPVGFAFDHLGYLIVSEATPSALSSYSVSPGGVLSVVSGSVPDHGGAACWVAVTNSAALPTEYTYTTNTHTSSISGYSVASNGALTLLTSNGISAQLPAGSHILDMALSADSQYLYVVQEFIGQITGFKVNSDGSLTQVTNVSGIPISFYGLTGF